MGGFCSQLPSGCLFDFDLWQETRVFQVLCVARVVSVLMFAESRVFQVLVFVAEPNPIHQMSCKDEKTSISYPTSYTPAVITALTACPTKRRTDLFQSEATVLHDGHIKI